MSVEHSVMLGPAKWAAIRAAIGQPWPEEACLVDAVIDRPESARQAAARWGVSRRQAGEVLRAVPAPALPLAQPLPAAPSAARHVVGELDSDGLDAYDRVTAAWASMWRTTMGGRLRGPTRGSEQGRRLAASIREIGEAGWHTLTAWYASDHPRALWLREGGYGLGTVLRRPGEYLELAEAHASGAGRRHAGRGGAVEREAEASAPLLEEIADQSMGDVPW